MTPNIKTVIQGDYALVNVKNILNPIYLRINTTDIDVFHQIFQREDYDIDFKFSPKIIVDCGANIGLSTIYFKNKYPFSTIISIEPENSNYNLLLKNTANYSDIHCLKCGVWNENVNLELVDNGWGHWGFVTKEIKENNGNSIMGVSIDEILKTFNLDNIDILKIDIEGSEKELFEKNTEKWLHKVKVIIIELHSRNGCNESFVNAMKNYNYSHSIKGKITFVI